MVERLEVMIEDADIGFLNFSGRETQFNDDGKRTFLCYLDPATAEKMFADGWNVKTEKERPDDEEGRVLRPFISCAVRYDIRPPRIFMITSNARTQLNEDAVGVLDVSDISMVDMVVTGSPWEMNGKSGIKAYVKSMYVTINEDALDRKYAVQPVEED